MNVSGQTSMGYFAARSDLEAQEMCRDLDERVNFVSALVKPYKKFQTSKNLGMYLEL